MAMALRLTDEEQAALRDRAMEEGILDAGRGPAGGAGVRGPGGTPAAGCGCRRPGQTAHADALERLGR